MFWWAVPPKTPFLSADCPRILPETKERSVLTLEGESAAFSVPTWEG
jgi:hypothetical protein